MKFEQHFGDLTLRHSDAGDRERLDRWIAADRFHAGRMTPEFFLGRFADGTRDPRPQAFAFEDPNGVVFYMRLSRAARVYMQFGPDRGLWDRARVASGMVQCMAMLEAQLAHAGVEQWIFDTESPGLKHLAESRLGFRESPNEMVRSIASPQAQKSQQGPSEGREGAV